MKAKIFVLGFILYGAFLTVAAQTPEGRTQVVATPYTLKIYNLTASGGQGTEITSNASIQPNTVYYVRVTTSTSGIASLLATGADGFETGYWSAGIGFLPYADPTGAQGDGSTLTFRIRTFSGFDFFTPLYIRMRQCSSGCANPGGNWVSNRPILFPKP